MKIALYTEHVGLTQSETITAIIIFICMGLAIAAYCKKEKLRKLFSNKRTTA